MCKENLAPTPTLFATMFITGKYLLINFRKLNAAKDYNGCVRKAVVFPVKSLDMDINKRMMRVWISWI
ncbi:MAG: hypothetical protein U1D67_04280, partial [Dehalococcoidia bacterium]|nr:hypothetical protein [Dehalococcoidia bacterium]